MIQFTHPYMITRKIMDFPDGSVVKNLLANAGDAGYAGLISGLGRSPVGGNGNLLQCFCWENPMESGAWQATVNSITKNQMQVNNWTHMHWKNHSLDYIDLGQQSDVSAFQYSI